MANRSKSESVSVPMFDFGHVHHGSRPTRDGLLEYFAIAILSHNDMLHQDTGSDVRIYSIFYGLVQIECLLINSPSTLVIDPNEMRGRNACYNHN